MGIYPNLDAAAASTPFQETILPRQQDHQVYARYFKIFEKLSVKLEEEFEEIANLQQGVE